MNFTTISLVALKICSSIEAMHPTFYLVFSNNFDLLAKLIAAVNQHPEAIYQDPCQRFTLV